jgi:hypothetical protein
MKTRDDNWQAELTEAYLIGELTEEQVRDEIEAMRAEVDTVPSYVQRSSLNMDQEQQAA